MKKALLVILVGLVFLGQTSAVGAECVNVTRLLQGVEELGKLLQETQDPKKQAQIVMDYLKKSQGLSAAEKAQVVENLKKFSWLAREDPHGDPRRDLWSVLYVGPTREGMAPGTAGCFLMGGPPPKAEILHENKKGSVK